MKQFSEQWLPPLEAELRAVLAGNEPATAAHYGMIHYHMGWVDAEFRPVTLPAGKRLRPLLCLMACQEVGGDPVQALPAAAALEILHNFSLVHDDIEDGDERRRHRPTVWALWGIPQAINAGDAMFALAFAALQRLSARGVAPETVLAALQLFTETCVALTEGQHLDMAFEQRAWVSVDEYMRMIQGKTAALIGASVAIGGLIGGAAQGVDASLRRFGQSIGLAFQIQDDVLGVWGDPTVTGKAAGADILRRKKSLPLLHALNHPIHGDAFRSFLSRPELAADDLPEAMELLARTASYEYATQQMHCLYQAGLDALQEALGERAERSLLWATAQWLMHRQM
ncbi:MULTISPECIES: polyprenyl synthetase family protein [Caldilinea]|uniref:Putative polyprenyl synthetase n=1 Tax=Caldilinea aerophila (strain DSM 14535 / JCM 11387 / NBRC 104270 / STL-6-O1) TaxID=926550 RepID=I0I2Z6_CALAS|nr:MULTISPECIES: polyprenyl synthetase family protein [Caldilinea]BAL99633.1 putative polyprenyl synthetase [Caldilinea aerophila DSM 14535 = NBRC 104270]GIV73767.1 MAG: polyprenyl synthetase [Caldilinea sp.]